MANSGGPNTNGSQFFIVVKTWDGLPPNYTIFGNVIDEANSFAALDKMITAEGTPIRAAWAPRLSHPSTSLRSRSKSSRAAEAEPI